MQKYNLIDNLWCELIRFNHKSEVAYFFAATVYMYTDHGYTACTKETFDHNVEGGEL